VVVRGRKEVPAKDRIASWREVNPLLIAGEVVVEQLLDQVVRRGLKPGLA
jgi:hypothetical protein